MADFFLGEIRLFPWNWAPRDWALCNGATLANQQNQALFSLLGITYGGDATHFKLPDLRGRAVVGDGRNPTTSTTYARGVAGGAEGVAVSLAQIPAHDHAVTATGDRAEAVPATGAYLGKAYSSTQSSGVAVQAYDGGTTLQALNPATVGMAGGGGMHDNMQPFLTLNYCIATVGIYPPRP